MEHKSRKMVYMAVHCASLYVPFNRFFEWKWSGVQNLVNVESGKCLSAYLLPPPVPNITTNANTTTTPAPLAGGGTNVTAVPDVSIFILIFNLRQLKCLSK